MNETANREGNREAVALRESLRRHEHRNDPMFVERVRALVRPGHEVAPQREEAHGFGYADIRHRLHRGLIEILNPQAVAQASQSAVEAAVTEYVDREIEGETVTLSRVERSRLKNDLVYELLAIAGIGTLFFIAALTRFRKTLAQMA